MTKSPCIPKQVKNKHIVPKCAQNKDILKKAKIRSEGKWRDNIKKLYNNEPKITDDEWLDLDPFRIIKISSIAAVRPYEEYCYIKGKYQTIYVISMTLKYEGQVNLVSSWYFMNKTERDEKHEWLKNKLLKK